MAGPAKKGQPKRRPARVSSLQQDIADINRLEAIISAGAPAPGSNPIALELPEKSKSEKTKSSQKKTKSGGKKGKGEGEEEEGEEIRPYAGARRFADLPLSSRTQLGLKEAKYVTMTTIQRAALPHALCGRDVLGAAKTGSGKTLAFVVPVIEKLYRLRWGHMDGVGAIIISPTRELASQIFNELKKAGKHHSLSGGLLIGGQKDVQMEKERVHALNILVCTPGRLLQHMDETPNFDCSQLQILVLDEADRILDLGFAQTLNAIIANLPKTRQTLLFSATQTKSVKDLARLSLRTPEYLAVHSESKAATPNRLQQTVMIVPLSQKVDMLWSFVKTHLQSKTMIFLSSCKQTKFVYEAFKRLRPGIPLKCLHGRMKQMGRLAVFYDFCETKNAVLFATDVAARGLDFPVVDWVVQMDCPDDVASYIHRVGRTARCNLAGRSLLFVDPSEAAMLPALEAAKIPFKITKANPNKVQQMAPAMAGLLSREPELKHMAQRAFVTYLRSIYLQSNKEIFDVSKLPLLEYAVSLGLPNAPRIRFLKKGQKKLAEEATAKAIAEGKVSGNQKKGRTEEEKESEGESEGEEGDEEGEISEDMDVDEGGEEGEEEEGEGEENRREVGGEGDEGDWRKLLVDEAVKNFEKEGKEAMESEGSKGKRSKNGEEETKVKEGGREANEKKGREVEGVSGKSGEDNKNATRERKRKSVEEEKEREGSGIAEVKKKEGEKTKRSKMDRLFKKKNMDVFSSAYEKLRANDEDSDGREDREGEGTGGEGKGEEDEFLHIKRFDHKLEGEGDEEVLPLFKSPSLSKRKKLKIDPTKTGNNRLVFTEGGEMLPPLAALGFTENDEENLPDGEKPSGNSIAAIAAERFRKLQVEMKKRDLEDRLLEKQRLRERRLKKKLKEKNARAGDTDKRESASGGVQLGKAGEDEDMDEGYMEEEEKEEEEEDRRDEREDDEGSLGLSEEDEDEDGNGDGRNAKFGNRMNERRQSGEKSKQRQARVGSLSVSEQEALALRLLTARKSG